MFVRAILLRLFLVLPALAALGEAGLAQVAPGADTGSLPLPSGPRRIEGRALRASPEGEQPLVGEWVTLHRVGADTAGAVDSVRTRRDGAFAFAFRPTGAPGAVYFLSVSHAGIAHFSLPWTAEEGGEDADVVVFDTTSAPVPIDVRGRHLIVFAPDAGGGRRIVEVYEIANDTIVTRIAGDTGSVWSGILPAGAAGFSPGPGDFSPGSLEEREGRVLLLAPMSPGTRQFSFAYTIAADLRTLVLPVGDHLHVLEVLLEEPDAAVSGAALAETSPVAIEGRMFRRFLSEEVPPGGVITVEVTPHSTLPRGVFVGLVLLAIGTAMLIALALNFRKRAAAVRVPVHFTPRMVDAAGPLAREIAQLDEEFSLRETTDPAERAAYEARRAELKARLTGLLAAQQRT